ncbi:MAG: aspartate kinase [Micavibrio sp.]
MARLVMKFGGTSVAGIPEIENAAKKVAAEVARGHQVAVAVSAMAGVTNQYVEYCRAISPLHDAREYDAVVASGENVTAGLMALALQKIGISARSWQGWQIPILTDEVHGKARIQKIDVTELDKRLSANEVAVIAGFQGITPRQRISTLGRGGSDTTAVAMAAALKADRCDIYTDVNGVYTTDPRIVPEARKLSKVSYEEMLEMASLGAKVLMTRSVEMAMKMNVPVQVLSSFEDAIGSDFPGTLVLREDAILEQHVVNGVTYSRNEAKVTLLEVPDVPGIAAKVFGSLSAGNINVDMIVQNVSPDGKKTDMTFTLPRSELPQALATLRKIPEMEKAEIRADDKVAKVSVIGIGMQSHTGVAQTMFAALAEKGINIQVISTSEIKISVLIDESYTELAIRAIHAAYKLEESVS